MPARAYPFWILDFGFWINGMSDIAACRSSANPKSKIQNPKSKIRRGFAKAAASAIDDTIRSKQSFLRRNHGTA
jgi:hypothetical protein